VPKAGAFPVAPCRALGKARPVTTVERLKSCIAALEIDPRSEHPPAVAKALALARVLQRRAVSLQSPEERRQQAEFERIMHSATDKATLMQLTDQAFRSRTPWRAADQLTHILDVQGIPRFFSTLDRAMLKGFQSFGSYLPGVSVPMVKEKMREETANVVLPAERELLVEYLEQRRKSGVRMNVNFLGEALLGEQDAQRRLEGYLAALQLPEIEVISVKVSTIYSQILPIARRSAVRALCDRLELLYRAAARSRFVRADGKQVPKLVYLDMEEHRDLEVTLEAFLHTLDRPGLEQATGGIALQAYIPDSFRAQQEINRWARARVTKGGAPVTLRLVKGANMETERLEASITGWPQAPFKTKLETDANYKRMLQEALEAENIAAVRLGVASHNLFEVAYAIVLGHERGVLDQMQFEMLEGMANHQRRALCELVDDMLLYAPATKRDEFVNAIGYLIRRLDENTGPENFLRYAFKLEVDGDEWKKLEQGFVQSFSHLRELSAGPRRTQDRNQQLPERAGPPISTAEFVNEPNTDFSLDQNLRWAERILESWKPRCDANATEIPLVIAGQEMLEGRELMQAFDPSRPGVVVARYRHASDQDIDRAIECARRDPTGWRGLDERARGQILEQVALELQRGRADLMGAAVCDGGKILTESDPEVSEAIDFVRYYAATARDFRALRTLTATPKGVVVVVPPWNFPIAIPCGGVSAALAAGNTVILKPASHTVLIAYELCKCFWRAGVPREALQLVPCSGGRGGARLVGSPEVDAVILTGGTNTALRMLDKRPDMNLCAETGGKNATIITAMSDREQAIKHVVHSAFSHTGQKCSATSLLVLEGEVYDDPLFREILCDAVQSLKVGSAWELDTRVGPMINPPSDDLERGLKELEPGESWAVMPHPSPDNPCSWSPGVKWGVAPGSYTHMTEFFGPVLAVLRAENLEHAIQLVNQTGYGLTSGLESLDEREQRMWRERIRAGNLYLNRVTTGAIVQRQPFGGVGKSAFGPGIKAGGPNYVAQLMDFRDRGDAPVPQQDAPLSDRSRALLEQLDALPRADRERLTIAVASYQAAFDREFGCEHDDVRLVGQDNIRRYLPVPALRVRVHGEDSAFEILARVAAAWTVGCHVTVSSRPALRSPSVALLDRLTASWGAAVEFVEETDAELCELIRSHQTDRVRYASPERVPTEVSRAVGDSGVYIARTPVVSEGRVELLWYVTEQSISDDYHRYGNLGMRADEPRRPVD
jgi:RHH-type transcriptional regulator, proline utilization regulon repressor / proline dehydrogenase / delta 1-pyrroline-5-carboxylate dehydrogenase